MKQQEAESKNPLVTNRKGRGNKETTLRELRRDLVDERLHEYCTVITVVEGQFGLYHTCTI
jgi:hypothetical protein